MILTAAHCLDEALLKYDLGVTIDVIRDLKVIVGMVYPGDNCPNKKKLEYTVKEYFIHPKFNFPYFDVGVLELERRIEYTLGIGPICLPSVSSSIDNLDGAAVSLSGWGATTPNSEPSKFLIGTEQLVVISSNLCQNKTRPWVNHYASVINRPSFLRNGHQESMEGLLCVEDQRLNGLAGSCEGDSGSPLVRVIRQSSRHNYHEQIGVVSGGICSKSNSPSVLVYIGHEEVLGFINEITNISK